MRAMELKVAVQTEDYEAAADLLSKISDLLKDHGDVIKMSTSLEEVEVRDRRAKLEVTGEAESYPLDSMAEPIDAGIPVSDHGAGLAPEEEG